jgi:hypothetical protein
MTDSNPNSFVTKPADEHSPERVKADWDKVRGNNHHNLSNHGHHWGGGFRYSVHIGKPLSDKLWFDLIYRMNVDSMCVYKPDDGQWCMGWGKGHCTIHIDENDVVRDIHLY